MSEWDYMRDDEDLGALVAAYAAVLVEERQLLADAGLAQESEGGALLIHKAIRLVIDLIDTVKLDGGVECSMLRLAETVAIATVDDARHMQRAVRADVRDARIVPAYKMKAEDQYDALCGIVDDMAYEAGVVRIAAQARDWPAVVSGLIGLERLWDRLEGELHSLHQTTAEAIREWQQQGQQHEARA